MLCLAVWCVAWPYLERVVGWFFASVWCVLGFGCFVWLYGVLCRPTCGRHMSALLIVCCAFCDSRDIMSVGRRARHTKGTNGCVARWA